jgi:hypothetical protein
MRRQSRRGAAWAQPAPSHPLKAPLAAPAAPAGRRPGRRRRLRARPPHLARPPARRRGPLQRLEQSGPARRAQRLQGVEVEERGLPAAGALLQLRAPPQRLGVRRVLLQQRVERLRCAWFSCIVLLRALLVPLTLQQQVLPVQHSLAAFAAATRTSIARSEAPSASCASATASSAPHGRVAVTAACSRGGAAWASRAAASAAARAAGQSRAAAAASAAAHRALKLAGAGLSELIAFCVNLQVD